MALLTKEKKRKKNMFILYTCIYIVFSRAASSPHSLSLSHSPCLVVVRHRHIAFKNWNESELRPQLLADCIRSTFGFDSTRLDSAVHVCRACAVCVTHTSPNALRIMRIEFKIYWLIFEWRYTNARLFSTFAPFFCWQFGQRLEYILVGNQTTATHWITRLWLGFFFICPLFVFLSLISFQLVLVFELKTSEPVCRTHKYNMM